MVKKEFILLMLMAAPAVVFAQLKVNSTGQVNAGPISPVNKAVVSAGDAYNYQYPSNYHFGLLGRAENGYYCIGVKGCTEAPSSAMASIGVQGLANGGVSGHMYGVVGGLGNQTSNGAGIFGTTYSHTGVTVSGIYAGYFDGPVYIDGTATVQQLVNSSDIRLKENVTLLKEDVNEGSTLANVLNMNVIKYNYIDRSANSDTAKVMKEETLKEMHYGLSAQELREIYPDLVREGQDGYLGINYIELVPILIRSIQELKAELDEVKGMDTGRTRSVEDNKEVFNTVSSKNVLYQNSPNPFKEQTIIRFSLADDARNAAICIFDMTGKTIKKLPISSGMDSVSIGGYELGEGMFLYSLVVNGQEIDTKRMIISK